MSEKETLVEAVSSIRRAYDEKLTELKSLKDTISERQELWIKEKLELQEKIAELENKSRRLQTLEADRNRLVAANRERDAQIEALRREDKSLKEDRDKARRKCEELSQKLTELERLERAARTTTITGKMVTDKEIQKYQVQLDHSEASHKGEMAALHAEYEGRMRLMGDEIGELQRQIAALCEERDRLRDQLDRDPNLRISQRYKDDVEDMTAQVGTLRNDLEAALLENRNLKVQAGTDRTSWQIQNAELKTKINQLEERILMEASRGSTRSYVKTKLELAWDKERQEQQRLLAETQKFIQEMRDKILTLETMRDKERQEARKQLHELKVRFPICLPRSTLIFK